MKAGVFSDTHGDLSRLDAALAKMGRLDAVIHLGDYHNDAPVIGQRAAAPVYAVQGNCDYRGGQAAERVVELGGARLFCTHGHRYPDIYALSLKAEQERCGAALFGHTHQMLLTASGALLIVNPGSLSRPRFGSLPGCALLTIEDGRVLVDMISL